MEDNPEVHMDTDVSSTTADVPETQEVTGSDGQVEMVIVVEKVDEESEMELSSVITDELPRVDNEVEAFSVSSPDNKVSSNDVEPNCEAEKSSAITEDTNTGLPVEDHIQEAPKELDDVSKIKDDITTTSTLPKTDTENQNSKDKVDSSDKPKVQDISVNQNETLEKSQEISEKKSPIKQLGMEEIQTTVIEISEKSYNADGKKEEVATISVDISEKSNDSHVDSISDVSDKDHNKSISRELKSLIKSAKESKIISACTQLTTKTRKSRVGLDNSSASPSYDADKILGRRNSNNSQLSNSSELSEKVPIKRSMRSQNPEFVIKVKQFLNSVTGKNNKGDSDDEGLEENKRDRFETMTPSPKKKKLVDNQEEHLDKEGKLRFDPYCWRCHWHVEQVANEKAHPPMYCTVCPRAYHYKCLSSAEKTKIDSEKSWLCPECLAILHAESSETRSPSMKKISLGLLRELFQHAVERIMDLNGVEPFMNPVDRAEFPDYDKYVVHPMDLSLVRRQVAAGAYGSTEALAADVQWILHNSIIFNTLQSKLTGGARALVRTCRAEMGEIEACAECYAAAHARRPTWFTDVCTAPHVLLWAKLKGFPYWPAKAMSVNSSGLVDVRFFGAHDRAWVPARDCFLYSEKDPNNFRTKRQDIIDSMQEAEHHIRNISRKYGKFVYPPFKTQFDPSKLDEHIKAMIPLIDGDLKSDSKEKPSTSSPSAFKIKRRSNSKSSKSSNNDGEVSDSEDIPRVTRGMADGAEVAGDEDYAVEKDSAMEIETPKKGEDSKKRRRSHLEEAVITIMDNSSSSKKRRHEGASKEKGSESTAKKSKIEIADKSKDITKIKKNESTPSKETPSSTDVNEESTAATPVRSVHKNKSHRSSTSKDRVEKEENRKTTKTKHAKVEKSGNIDMTPESKGRSEKRAYPKNKSTNNSFTAKVDKKEKYVATNNVTDRNDNKHKGVELDKSNTPKTKNNNPEHGKNGATRSSKKSSQLDNTFIGKGSANDGLPTISSVRSLSDTVQTSNQIPDTKTLEITIEANSESSIFTSTSTPKVRNMKEAVNKIHKLRNGTDQSLIGKVGVKAFARMKSPEKAKQNVEVEIKAEPIDFDDADRQVEKLDLMNVFRLRPVNPLQTQPQKLRDIRINKVVVAPVIRNAAPKQQESRKARKTFPQPKKPDEGRSELNGKNSMVYIPIQPPSSQAPVRPLRPITISASTPCARPPASSTASTLVNSVRPPMIPMVVTSSAPSLPAPTLPPPSFPPPSVPPPGTVVTKSNLPMVPTVGQMSATVQTVPLITTVNGQCFFSLQPLMSVGGVDPPPLNSPQPVVSEFSERSAVLAPVVAPSAPATGPVTAAPPQLNGAAKDTIGEMPRLQQRPNLSHLESAKVALPASGPVNDKLNQSAAKLTDFFRSLLEDVLESVDDPASNLAAAKLQLEQAQWKHQQEIQELKHNHDLTVSEMRASLEKDKIRAVAEALRTVRAEADAAVKAAKAKQWCANCSQEAQFYCCWNTSYCDFPCQRMHWKKHFSVCTQERNQDGDGGNDPSSPHKRLQPAPDNVPKSTAAPALTVGGKVAAARSCAKATQEQAKGNKSSIIVSMVDDKSGTPSVKCVGTYKAGAAQATPLIINNQILNNEESAKKVVTSGGYLIVGSGSSSPLVAPRRPHAIQYYT